MGTERWELSIPNGPFKGRYAFVDASGAMSSGEYNEGRLVTRMRDRGIRLDKPDYRLKGRAWLESEVRRKASSVSTPLPRSTSARSEGPAPRGSRRSGRPRISRHNCGTPRR